MNTLSFSNIAWEHYLYWQTEDKKTLNKINDLIKDILRNDALSGIGKPERLRHGDGYSRRIDKANRLVYTIESEGAISIIACKGHYED